MNNVVIKKAEEMFMGKLKVVSGDFGGRFINFNNKKYNNADITPSKIKEAVFSIIGHDIKGKTFLDLFSCSGQMGLEALSRGAELVCFNEYNSRRFQFIKTLVDDFHLSVDRFKMFNKKWEQTVKILDESGIRFDFIYLDPPYEKIKGRAQIYEKLLSEISESSIVNSHTVIMVQHFSSNDLDENYGDFNKIKTRVYGTNTVTIYSSMGA